MITFKRHDRKFGPRRRALLAGLPCDVPALGMQQVIERCEHPTLLELKLRRKLRAALGKPVQQRCTRLGQRRHH